jgi:hypothetical protein
VDVFTNDGAFVRRLVTRGALDSPWGLALAPAGHLDRPAIGQPFEYE